MSADAINPSHYKGKTMECVDVLEAWRLGPHLWNAAKYVIRAHHKGSYTENMRKAQWYLDRVSTAYTGPMQMLDVDISDTYSLTAVVADFGLDGLQSSVLATIYLSLLADDEPLARSLLALGARIIDEHMASDQIGSEGGGGGGAGAATVSPAITTVIVN